MWQDQSLAQANYFEADRPDVPVPQPDPKVAADDDASDERLPSTLPEWLSDLFPFQTRSVAVVGERMSFVDEGSAANPPLLMLHGNPGWSFTFRKIIGDLRKRFRVIAPDLVGFGLSSKPQDWRYHTIECHIENVTSLIQQLGLRNVTMLLHDWGGPVGLGYATQRPENVSRIVLTNTWGFPLPHLERVQLPFGVRLAQGGAVGRYVASSLGLMVTSAVKASTVRPVSDMVMEGYRYPFHHKGTEVAMRCFWQMLKHPNERTIATLHNVEANLLRIQAPVDILWGRDDRYLSKLPAYMLRDRLQRSREPIIVNQAGHMLAEDAPEVIVRKLLEKMEGSAAVAHTK